MIDDILRKLYVDPYLFDASGNSFQSSKNFSQNAIPNIIDLEGLRDSYPNDLDILNPLVSIVNAFICFIFKLIL